MKRTLAQLENLEKWKHIIIQWTKSNLNMNDYCMKHSINKHTLQYHKRNLEEEGLKFNVIKRRRKGKCIENWKNTIIDWQKSKLSMETYCKNNYLNLITFRLSKTKVYSKYKEIKYNDFPIQKGRPKEDKYGEYGKKFWYDMIHKCVKSDLPIDEFFKKHRIGSKTYYMYKKLLESENVVFDNKSTPIDIRPWVKTIKDWQKSKLTAIDYCNINNIAYNHFLARKKKVYTLLKMSKETGTTTIPLAFVEVVDDPIKDIPEDKNEIKTITENSNCMTLQSKEGIVINIPESASTETLVKLIKTLRTI